MEALLVVAGVGALALSIPLMRVAMNLILRTYPSTTNYTSHDS